MNLFPEILTKEKLYERNIEFRDSLFSLDENVINEQNVIHLIRIYNSAKLLEIRNKILKLLYNFEYSVLLEFFKLAYKRERGLEMKMYALRGLSQFITEKEIENILKRFNLTLSKRKKSTPYNYVEYEFLKGKNCLPFLIEKYDYNCFIETFKQVNKQYNEMPIEFKGHFNVNENGEVIKLRSSEKSRALMDDFFNRINYE